MLKVQNGVYRFRWLKPSGDHLCIVTALSGEKLLRHFSPDHPNTEMTVDRRGLQHAEV